MKSLKITGTIAIVITIASLLLSACGAGAPATPTTDPGAVYTMAAATVQAQLTQAAAANPTAVPPTETPLPPPTVAPTVAPAPTQEQALQPTLPFAAAAAPTVAGSVNGLNPLMAPTQSSASAAGFKVGDYAEFQYNVPADLTVYAPGEPFQLEVGFKNVGSVTWTTEYALVFIGGDQMSGITKVPLKVAVKPGEKAIFNIDQKAPGEPGKKYTTRWALATQTGAYVINGEMYLTIIVKN